jgi:hypothetical protein
MTSDPDLAERIPGILLRIIRTGSVHFHKDKSRQRCAYAEIQNNAPYEFRERSAGVKRVLNYCANVRDIEMNKAKTKNYSKSDTHSEVRSQANDQTCLGGLLHQAIRTNRTLLFNTMLAAAFPLCSHRDLKTSRQGRPDRFVRRPLPQRTSLLLMPRAWRAMWKQSNWNIRP